MLANLFLSDVDPNPDQPRKRFDPTALHELADSIEAAGLIQPIAVRRAGDRYQIIAGERRWRAACMLRDRGGPATIRALVSDATDEETEDRAIIENLQRVDITPLEEADAFKRLADRGLSPEEIAKRVGCAVFRVRWRLSLLNLDPGIKALLGSGQIDRQEALELSRLPSQHQTKLLGMINRKEVSGWKAVRNAVDAIMVRESQGEIFGEATPRPSEADVQTLRSMERRIESVVTMVNGGWKNGECVIASRIDPDRASVMADKLAELIKAVRIMERELRNTGAQARIETDGRTLAFFKDRKPLKETLS